jgi:hypothetical protein
MTGVSPHEQASITVTTGVLTAKVRVQTVVKYFGFIKEAFGLNFCYFQHTLFLAEMA